MGLLYVQRRHATTELTLTEKDQARFWGKTALPNREGCLLWTGTLHHSGYGQFKLHGRSVAAHRVAYELRIGPIPPELVLDHLCRVRHCVAPAHLEAVTNAENIRRGETGLKAGTHMRAKTHCPQGHPYDGANTYVRPDGSRICRMCKRLRDHRYYEQKTT